MSYIVTGSSGFIGSTLCDYLCKKYPDKQIIGLSKHTYAVTPKMVKFLEGYPNYKQIAVDITDYIRLYAILHDLKPERIFHLAGESHVDRSFSYPLDFINANIHGTFNILEIARTLKRKPKILFVSTDETLGSIKEGYREEKHVLHPENPYAATKACAEMLCCAWYHSFGVPVVVSRSMNVLGERQNPEKLIPKIITNLLSDKEYNLYKGNSMRGWIYVGDVVDALDMVMSKGKCGDIYHIPPCAMKGVYDINEYILSLMPSKRHLFKSYVSKRLKDDDRYALHGSKMQFDLGWTPRTSWDDAIKKTIKWYDDNREMWS